MGDRDHPVYKTLCLFEAIVKSIEEIALLGTLDVQEDATLADITDAVTDLQVRWGNRRAADLNSDPEQVIPTDRRLGIRRICGKLFGEELLLPGMKPGTGMYKCCLLWSGHEGDCDDWNPGLEEMISAEYDGAMD